MNFCWTSRGSSRPETAAYRPGKWLRGSSRELGGSKVPAGPGLAPGMQQAQQAFLMLQNMSMLMDGGNTGTGGVVSVLSGRGTCVCRHDAPVLRRWTLSRVFRVTRGRQAGYKLAQRFKHAHPPYHSGVISNIFWPHARHD